MDLSRRGAARDPVYTEGVRSVRSKVNGAAAEISFQFGAWLSLVERLVRDQEAGGSNPLAPTNVFSNL